MVIYGQGNKKADIIQPNVKQINTEAVLRNRHDAGLIHLPLSQEDPVYN